MMLVTLLVPISAVTVSFLVSEGFTDGCFGAEADDDRIKLLLSQVKGKDISELIAAGREKFASVPAGGGGIAVASPTSGGGAPAAAAAAAEPKKEEKVEEKEESDDVGHGIQSIRLKQVRKQTGTNIILLLVPVYRVRKFRARKVVEPVVSAPQKLSFKMQNLIKLHLLQLLFFEVFVSPTSKHCGSSIIQEPQNPTNSSVLNSMILCKSDKLYFRTTVGLFPVSSVDYSAKLLTVSHNSCSPTSNFISPYHLSAGFPSPPRSNSLILLNCSKKPQTISSSPCAQNQTHVRVDAQLANLWLVGL
ncbi:hypothetical protein F511_42261 [Dorcoceras hygrometricum]|uniref:Uncharacterized protein n=1 Tax=Dorcoceras hygrometricum TaxID=472368 RepID=A0A2Z7A0C0_9LAMI|nr:hypothetical protein F511_42261 [Dorcoceras hygrometricum]